MTLLDDMRSAERGNLYCNFTFRFTTGPSLDGVHVLMIEDYPWLKAPINTAEDLDTIEETLLEAMNVKLANIGTEEVIAVTLTGWKRMEI